MDDGGTGDSIEGGPAGADCESLVDMGVALEGVARTSGFGRGYSRWAGFNLSRETVS